MNRDTAFPRLAAWLGVIGFLLASTAAMTILASSAGEAGDVDSIESSVTDTLAATLVVDDTPAGVAHPNRAEDPAPLWSANDSSLLADLAASDRKAPVGLRIDSLGVAAPVDPYGISRRTGQMAVPRNVRDVGWYRHGPSPGEPGSAVLAAHVDLEGQGPGVFFDLRTLDPGEPIMVTYDDGSERWFEVEARKTYKKAELPLQVIFSRKGAPFLTLITCGGGFSHSDRAYDSNVVVYAIPLEASPPVIPAS